MGIHKRVEYSSMGQVKPLTWTESWVIEITLLLQDLGEKYLVPSET